MACAQTPASQANESQWKQTPEGRTPEGPTGPMNCSGGLTKGDDGKWTTTSNCGPAQDKPVPSNAAQQFPYPGETATPKQQTTQTPNAPGTQSTPASPAQQFPYPGESGTSSSSSSSKSDVKPAPPGGLQDAGSSGSSSSSSSSGYSSSDAGGIPGAGDNQPDDTSVPTKTRASRRRPAEPVKTNAQQFAEDMQVAAFYQNDGDYRGAYMRASDAVSLSADDPDAHLALAEAARKLGKLDEAEANYKKCLSLDPVPKTRKAAEEALKQMTGGG
ncbi:MAG TPA: tetratricopeptide repeat protein [Candidatus Aquilonibacter sp.]|nr:tetratricopeptide repeat protein [Candidatus Aquilonibacter sp.]